jgi:hypothetical protein
MDVNENYIIQFQNVIHACICYNYACFICVSVLLLLYYAKHKVSLVKNTTDNRAHSGLILFRRT